MADEVLDGAPEGAAEVTDLRSTIRAAVEAQRSQEPVAADVPEKAEAVAPEKVEKAAAPDKADKTETEAERNERLRDDKGRFANKTATPDPAAPKVAPSVTAEAPPVTPGEAVKPPPGFSPTAKVVWDKETLSKDEWEAVKRDIAKRNDEVGKGLAELTEYKPIKQYIEMARQSGTTLDKALERYVGIEQQISRDMVGGVAQIAQNQGIHPVALANQILARYGAAPSEVQAGDQPAARQQAAVDLTPITQELNALKSYVQQQQTSTVQTEIQRFASDPKHTFFENVRADMGRLINAGYAADLEDAYEKACWANTEIRQLLIKQQAVPAPSANPVDVVQKAKAAAKATGGAPSAGFVANPGTAGASIRDTIRAAVNAQRGI